MGVCVGRGEGLWVLDAASSLICVKSAGVFRASVRIAGPCVNWRREEVRSVYL